MIKNFSIGGMSCTACSLGIERNVSKLDGVKSVSVSLMDKKMSVDFDSTIVNEQIIIATVEKLGYTAQIFGTKKQDKYQDAKKLKRRFLVSLLFLIPLVYLSMGGMLGLPVPKSEINFIIQWVIATCILVFNRKFFINGTKAVKNLSPNMDTLVSLGSISAYIYSVVLTVLLFNGRQIHHTFFEASAMVVTLVTLGKWLEELSKVKTGDAIDKLSNLLPKTVTLIKEGKEYTVLTSELNVGDVILLKAGEYVAVDGVVINGHASIDKSAITGESMPEEVSIGGKISSGSIIKDGFVYLKAEKVKEQTLFSKIIEIVRTAGASKAPIQKIADKISGIFVPIVTLIAIIAFVVWIIISGNFEIAFTHGIAVLVISCPCSLGLATPVAVMAGTGRAANHGILFKSASALQQVYKINCVLLDKTATITVGKPKVTDYINFTGESEQTLFPIVSALESKSNHPLADCIVEYCGKSEKTVIDFEYVIGKGLVGIVDKVKYYIGNLELLPNNVALSEIPNDFDGKTIIYFADEYQLISIFALADYIKEDSRYAIKSLNDKNVKTVMITGDNERVAKKIAKQVGINEYFYEVLPQDKYSIVEEYKEKGYFTAMVGDGINDSPALKSANIGVAMGTGTDIAMDSSDVIIVNGNLSALNDMIDISNKSVKIIKQNLFWAFFYNALGIPIAAGVLSFIGINLTPAIASAFMSLSSLFVVTNALRITEKKKKIKKTSIKETDLIKIILIVEGMTCNHCVSKVETALKNVKGVYSVNVLLKEKTATVKCEKTIAENQLVSAITDAGFIVKSVETAKK